MIKVTLTKCGEIGIGNKEYISISDIEYENTSGTPIEIEDTWKDVYKYDDVRDISVDEEEQSKTEPIYNFINFVKKFRDNRLHRRLHIYITTNASNDEELKIIPDFNAEIQNHDVWANYIDYDIEAAEQRFCVKNHSLEDYYIFSKYDSDIFKEIIKEMILTKELFKNIFQRFRDNKVDTLDITAKDLYDEIDKIISQNPLLDTGELLNTGSDDDAINAKSAIRNFIDNYFIKKPGRRINMNKKQLAELIISIKEEIGKVIFVYVQQAKRQLQIDKKKAKIEPLEIEPTEKKPRTWKEWFQGKGGKTFKVYRVKETHISSEDKRKRRTNKKFTKKMR